MGELVILLEKLFNKDTRYHDIDEIKKTLGLKGEERLSILKDALNHLVESGVIFYDKKFGYRIFPPNSGLAFGRIEINRAGRGFVHTKDGYTIIIENGDLNGSLNGDNVIVKNIYSRGRNYYGEIDKITKRLTGKMIFEIVGDKHKTFIPYSSLDNIQVKINPTEYRDLVDGDIILVSIGCDNEYGYFDGTIDKVIGNKNDPDTDVKLIVEKYGYPTEFSNEVLEEATKIPAELSEADLKDRIDLRDEITFTIDCDNTKDRDDAVSIKRLDNGNYLLKVSIAHVSHYVKEDSLIFEEALKRCSSLYPLNYCVPMLPKKLSNDICSLNPGQDRLTRTVEMEINKKGEIVNYNIYKSVINSNMAMSYSNVNRLLNGESIDEYNKYKKELELFKELNAILEAARNKRNYINFNTKEVMAVKEKNNTVFKENDLGLAGQMIENFMLVANTTVYRHFAWYVLAYRIHEAPDIEKVSEVLSLLRKSGIKIPKIKNINALCLKSIINDLSDDDVSLIIRENLLRSMKKAKYDTTNIGHYALQYDIYGHFTSPIRRIIDLITHMSIDDIEKYNYNQDSVLKFEEFLNDVCVNANRTELDSKLIEDESMDMVQAEYMSKHIGEEFELYIVSVFSNSMLVRTKNLIRGKIRIEDLLDDKYYYDYDKRAIIGKKTRKKYQIGNKIYAIVKDASKENRTVYFEIPKQKILSKNTI